MPNLYMLIGIPCSGKSTWIEKNVNREEAVVLSSDAYIQSVADMSGSTYNEVFSNSIKLANENLKKELSKAIIDNKAIFWDQTNISINSRKKKLNDPRLQHYVKYAIVFNTPFDCCLSRNNQRIGKVIPLCVMESMRNNFEYPTYSEDFFNISEA